VGEGRSPRGHFVNFFESIILFVRNEIILPNMGHKGVKYIPYFLTFFFFILFSNLLGMLPWAGTCTGNLSVTASLAGIVFFMIFVFGSIEQGGPHVFLKNMVPGGTPWWLWPFMFLIEAVVGPLAKCFALAMRLFANMIAGHIVIAVLLGMGIVLQSTAVGFVASLGAVAMSLLEIFVCFLQAYIFTLLAVIFVGGAIQPEH
jgi:F-type H+-transporting ATPase subunit a